MYKKQDHAGTHQMGKKARLQRQNSYDTVQHIDVIQSLQQENVGLQLDLGQRGLEAG